MHDRYVTVCPYLKLGRALQHRGWSLCPLSEFQSNWANQEFEQTVRSFVANFTEANGSPVDDPVLIYQTNSGMDGSKPTPDEINALQLALDFSVLDVNPNYQKERDHSGWRVATTDNSEIQIWRVGGGKSAETIRGLLVRTRSLVPDAGSDDFKIRATLETPVVGLIYADPEVFSACHELYIRVLNGTGGKDQLAIINSVRWLSKAWRNSSSLGWEDRIVMLKTAFEALTRSSQSWKSANRLRALFEQLRSSEQGTEVFKELLWSPDEKERWPASYTDKDGNEHHIHRTDLEHWFVSFSEARNSIIHDGAVGVLSYAEDTAYRGPFFWTAERLLREAVKIKLHHLGNRYLWLDGMSKAAVQFASRIADNAS